MQTNKLTLEELPSRIGQILGVSSWITVDQARINDFAACTGDQQWIHTDVARARADSPFGTTVAHGYLSLSLLAPTSFEVLGHALAIRQAVNFGLDKVRFLAPVPSGKRVRNHIKLMATEQRHGCLLVTTENSIEVEGDEKPAVYAVALALLMA